MTACTKDEDCSVRTKECCECGRDTVNLVAIATSELGSYDDLVCDHVSACEECLPSYDRTARCSDGHCAVALW